MFVYLSQTLFLMTSIKKIFEFLKFDFNYIIISLVIHSYQMFLSLVIQNDFFCLCPSKEIDLLYSALFNIRNQF